MTRLRPVALAAGYAVAAFQRQADKRRGYTSSQRGVTKYVRAATARGTRRRGYFAAAVAARSRSRQAIMAAFLQIPPSAVSGPALLSLSLSFFPFFLRRLRFSPPLSFPSCLFLLSRPLPVLRLCCFLSVLSRLLYPLLRNQTRGPRWYAAQWRRRRRCRPLLTHLHV